MMLTNWKLKGSDDQEYSIECFPDQVNLKSGASDKIISIDSIFEMYAPFDLFAPENQLEIFSFLTTSPDINFPVSAKAQNNFDFWKCVHDVHLPWREYLYETKITNISKWKLEISESGLVYHDLSSHYHPMPKACSQTLSDFWYYGPLYPIPDIPLRTDLIHELKDNLISAGFLFPESHHRVLRYPDFISPPMWEDGDYLASNFVILRSYGIEYGRQNFRDGLVGLGFVSFEHCMNREDCTNGNFTKEIRESVIEIIEERN